MVNLLWPTGRSDVLRLCGHADVNGDLEVVLLLADEGLIRCRVVEPFISVNMVGRRRPGNTEEKPFLLKSKLTKLPSADAGAWCKDCDISWSVQHFGKEQDISTTTGQI